MNARRSVSNPGGSKPPHAPLGYTLHSTEEDSRLDPSSSMPTSSSSPQTRLASVSSSSSGSISSLGPPASPAGSSAGKRLSNLFALSNSAVASAQAQSAKLRSSPGSAANGPVNANATLGSQLNLHRANSLKVHQASHTDDEVDFRTGPPASRGIKLRRSRSTTGLFSKAQADAATAAAASLAANNPSLSSATLVGDESPTTSRASAADNSRSAFFDTAPDSAPPSAVTQPPHLTVTLTRSSSFSGVGNGSSSPGGNNGSPDRFSLDRRSSPSGRSRSRSRARGSPGDATDGPQTKTLDAVSRARSRDPPPSAARVSSLSLEPLSAADFTETDEADDGNESECGEETEGGGTDGNAAVGRHPVFERAMRRIWPDMPREERLRHVYMCATPIKVLRQGHMFLTQGYICFYANIFGFQTSHLIPLSTIDSIQPAKTAGIIPNAITIITSDGSEYFYTSFVSRDRVLRSLRNLLAAASGTPATLIGSASSSSSTLLPTIPLGDDDLDDDLEPSTNRRAPRRAPRSDVDDDDQPPLLTKHLPPTTSSGLSKRPSRAGPRGGGSSSLLRHPSGSSRSGGTTSTSAAAAAALRFWGLDERDLPAALTMLALVGVLCACLCLAVGNSVVLWRVRSVVVALEEVAVGVAARGAAGVGAGAGAGAVASVAGVGVDKVVAAAAKVSEVLVAAVERKERLRQIKANLEAAANGEDDDEPLQISFRGEPAAAVATTSLKRDKPEEDETLESRAKRIQTEAVPYESVASQPLDLNDLAPKKPGFDLARDLEKRMERLDKETNYCIAEMIRKRLKAERICAATYAELQDISDVEAMRPPDSDEDD
ncbi:hypothetical protein HK101_007979 [Irineochytrium annulatum]|nr:hypothetical protein HK101_007979 [Irineochytrium annulatum]